MSLRKYIRQVRPIQEYSITPDDKIQIFLSEAASTASTLFEGVIADCANASTNKAKFQKEILKISESSKYPSIQRDLSFLIPENVEYEKLKALAEKMAGKELVNLKLFDLYKNSGIQEASSSYALNFTWQSKHKTLRDVSYTHLTLPTKRIV